MSTILQSSPRMLKCSTLVSKIDRIVQKNQQLRMDPAKIKNLLDIMTEWKTCFGTGRRCKNYLRKVLYFVLERMFWSRFDDSQYVARLLIMMLEIEGHLYCAIVQNIQMCPSLTFVEVYEFSDYFIRHAYRGKVVFGCRRLLNADMYDYHWHSPVEMAASMPDPALLAQMLRYGALLASDQTYISPKRFRYGGTSLTAVMSTLSSIVRLNPNILALDDLELDSEDQLKYRKYIRCCELLLKDSPSWPVNFITAVGGLKRKSSMLNFVEIFSTNVIKDFRKHFVVPMDLKQACRLRIRRILNGKWLLPHGIHVLVIPERLKIYLDS